MNTEIKSLKQVNKEIQKIAFGKNVEMKIYQLYLVVQILDSVCKRGGIHAHEMSQAGALFDIFSGAINKAYEISEREIINETTNATINETTNEMTNEMTNEI